MMNFQFTSTLHSVQVENLIEEANIAKNNGIVTAIYNDNSNNAVEMTIDQALDVFSIWRKEAIAWETGTAFDDCNGEMYHDPFENDYDGSQWGYQDQEEFALAQYEADLQQCKDECLVLGIEFTDEALDLFMAGMFQEIYWAILIEHSGKSYDKLMGYPEGSECEDDLPF